jgi:hypothetical protein
MVRKIFSSLEKTLPSLHLQFQKQYLNPLYATISDKQPATSQFVFQQNRAGKSPDPFLPFQHWPDLLSGIVYEAMVFCVAWLESFFSPRSLPYNPHGYPAAPVDR